MRESNYNTAIRSKKTKLTYWEHLPTESHRSVMVKIPIGLLCRMKERTSYAGCTMKALIIEAVERMLKTEDQENPIPSPDDESV